MATTNEMTITITRPYARLVCVWTDLETCEINGFGFSDDEIDAMVAAKAHEGADFPGVTVEVK